VAYAIAKKDVLHFFRYPLNALFEAIQPITWLAPVYFLGKSFAMAGGNRGFAGYTGTTDYMSFILLGAVVSGYVSSVFWGIGFSLKREMDSGVLETNWMAPVPRPLFLAGQTVANIMLTTLTNAVLLFLGWLFFGFQATGNVFSALVTLVPVLIALYGFGFAFAALVLLMKDAFTLVDVSSFLITLLSGNQFPVQVLPRFLLPVALALPLTYGYDAIRGFLLGTRTILPIQYEILILSVFMLVMAPIGFAVFKLVERRCRKLGNIGAH
jgi:ABC-2 type transport system permease protein